MGKVISIHGRLKDKKFNETIDHLYKNVLIPNLNEVWPKWEDAFDEAARVEAALGTEAGLEVLKALCPFDLEKDESGEV